MKKLATSLLMTGIMAVSLCGVAMADDSEKGPFTTENPTFARVATLPFRAISGTGGFAIGLVGGGLKGMVEGFREAGDWTTDVHDKEDGDVSEQVVRNALFIPTWAMGSAVLVPKNMLEDSLTTGWDLAGKGCQIWDRL